jgi:hypothetical protein
VFKVCPGTRLTHAAVRHLLPQSSHWRAVTDDQDFIPISNGDILITFHTFSLFDQFIRGLAMLFLDNGTSSTYTPITVPTANRAGS